MDLPEAKINWSLMSLQPKLNKIDAHVQCPVPPSQLAKKSVAATSFSDRSSLLASALIRIGLRERARYVNGAQIALGV